MAYSLAVALLLGLAIYSNRSQHNVDRYILSEYAASSPGWKAIEQLPSGSRIAWFDNYDWEYYPLYGRRWQFSLRRVNRDGTPYLLAHIAWLGRASDANDTSRTVENLMAGDADYVFVSKHQSNEWPRQYGVISDSADARKIYDDGYNAIFELLRGEKRQFDPR